MARLFTSLGASVVIAGRREDKINAVADELGDRCLAVRSDVTDGEDRRNLVARTLTHGGGRIDTLVNAAGNMYRSNLSDIDDRQVLDLFDANVVGPVMLSREALPALRDSRGSIVFFGSVHTQRAFRALLPYAATKGALPKPSPGHCSRTRSSGVRVNCIRPGGCTEINERAGLGTGDEAKARLNDLAAAHALGPHRHHREEVAESVVHLATADWITGTVLTVDGGLALGVTNA